MTARPEPVLIPGDRIPDSNRRRTQVFVHESTPTHIGTVWNDPVDGWTGIPAWQSDRGPFRDRTKLDLARKMIAHWELDQGPT